MKQEQSNAPPKSLDKLMKEMASRLEMSKPERHDAPSRLDILIKIDPILAALHKEYCDAVMLHEKLTEHRGEDDAMTEVACDMRDSAKTALETRMLELDEEEQGEGERAVAMRRAVLRERARAEMHFAELKAARKKREDADTDMFFWLVVWMWISRQAFGAARRHLSARSAFSHANPVLGSAWKGAQAA